ncbi:MAG: cysteine desulfurase [Planctomycetia bacterium]|nr:cysteine desulfurase [Planctomycetia bacterium]
MQSIYLDHNATTPLLPEVAEAMDRAARAGYANPASQHAAGRRARRIIEDARERIAEILGVNLATMQPDRLLFTSGGTEANNLALSGLVGGAVKGELAPAPPAAHVLLSAIEHPSIVGPGERLAAEGYDVEQIPVDGDGRVEVARFAQLLRPTSRLVSLMLGNNETGVLQPVAEVAALCRAQGVLMHTDAAQAVGKIEVDFGKLGVDALSAAAHKFHGPLGIGLLALRRGVVLRPLLIGGFQQEGLRPGTESPVLVVGLLTALEIWARDRETRTAHLTMLRNELERRLLTSCPQIVVHGARVARLPQTLNIAFVGANRQAMLMALDQAGVACSTGSACASGSSRPSPTLEAMCCSPAELESSLRFSVGSTTTTAEIVEAAARITAVFHELSSSERT